MCPQNNIYKARICYPLSKKYQNGVFDDLLGYAYVFSVHNDSLRHNLTC